LLTAELLINGRPLARLPAVYTKHPTHNTLFDGLILDVMPSDQPGMEFSAMRPYAGCEIHFGMKTQPNHGVVNPDMLVRAIQNGRMQDLIPSRMFKAVLPTAYIVNYVHWYDRENCSIEFRPAKFAWTSSSENWRLCRVGQSWALTLHNEAIVGINSSIATTCSSIFASIESNHHIHLLYDRNTRLLNIELPRLRLGFFVEPGSSQIHSKQFRGMSIDLDQNIGTLIGLRNKLVLKHKNERQDRLVVIPEGQISYSLRSQYTEVVINEGTASTVHSYSIDKLLTRLLDNGNLHGKLFLCYLHILTSSCQPDPLTGRTGAEQAISILKSGAVKSFDQLSAKSTALLDRIAKVCPSRNYYPKNEHVMQEVGWDSRLSFLTQMGQFHNLVSDLFQQAREAKILFPKTEMKLPDLNFIDPLLLQRDLIRSATFRVAEFGAEQFSTLFDAEYYEARDQNQNSVRANRVTRFTTSILKQQQERHEKVNSQFCNLLWNRLILCNTIKGQMDIANCPQPQYDAIWLEQPQSHLHPFWCPLLTQLSGVTHQLNRFQVMIWLSTLAYSGFTDVDEIQALVAVYNNPEISRIEIPSASSFRLLHGHNFKKSAILEAMKSSKHPLNICPEQNILQNEGETISVWKTRRQNEYSRSQESSMERCASELKGQWPCEIPSTPKGSDFDTYINLDKAMHSIRSTVKIWYDNWQLYQYITRLANSLCLLQVSQIPLPSYELTMPGYLNSYKKRYISIEDVFSRSPSPVAQNTGRKLNIPVNISTSATNYSQKLYTLVVRLALEAKKPFEKRYVEELYESINSLQSSVKSKVIESGRDKIMEILQNHLVECTCHLEDLSRSMTLPSSESRLPLAVAIRIRQTPRVSPILFLQQLNKDQWDMLSSEWKERLLQYGLSITAFQRAKRILTIHVNHGDILEEILNEGHQNRSPYEFPESLLLEVESGLMIRQIQDDISRHMRFPPSCQNAVMQLNMEEGKSSVIVPIVAATLADRHHLVRVVVGKPQSKQMLQMLISKLGGLLNRRIYLMPFSRILRLTESQANGIGKLYRHCMENRGILLVQPEHILSFKLMGLESLLTGNNAVGESLLNTYRFFEKNARDIVDESDENFSVKFELIYTMGNQRHIELSPERWNLIQSVLDLVPRFAREVKQDMPNSIEMDDYNTDRFPKTRFLRDTAAEEVLVRIARHICSTGLPGLPIARQSTKIREAIYQYITHHELSAEVVALVESDHHESFWTASTKGPLLLIRGLISHDVLSFAFGTKRWRVNYGLDGSRIPRTHLAVPFRAKDSPTPRSEFSHPDVVIVLTCLSYYYAGLQDEEIFVVLRCLIKSDQAQIEYGEWTKTAPKLPKSFRQLGGINFTDTFQCKEHIFPHLRYSKGAIDYYLSHIVFPKEIKEFPHKISATGWDIGEVKTHPTTGFSGTNDSRHALPLSVTHLDLPAQKHTNALVLKYLLQEENSVELMSRVYDDTTNSNSEMLLAVVCNMSPEVRVILDVGAQILEYTNLELAQKWLAKSTDRNRTKAVIFFNNDDELSVVDYNGRIELLQTSPFASQLDVCLVFLDEAHTRGTDLKLPTDYRAAVTLGPDLTKDRLAQGEFFPHV
jgi:Protein of unknown function (DUF3638)/Protein of unknown function (DUF3645)